MLLFLALKKEKENTSIFHIRLEKKYEGRNGRQIEWRYSVQGYDVRRRGGPRHRMAAAG